MIAGGKYVYATALFAGREYESSRVSLPVTGMQGLGEVLSNGII
jgi:hypothetical protein